MLSLLLHATMNHFLIRLWPVMKSGFYMTTGDNQLISWTEKLQSTSQSQTCIKERSWSLSAALLIHYNLRNPRETITSKKYAQQIHEIHQKLQCLQTALVKRRDPILLHNNTWLHVAQSVLQKLNKLGYKVLPHLSYSPDLLSTDYHFFRLLDIFFQGKCFHD